MKPVVAIVGRPNVGKSTLFNRILGRRKAIVRGEPGTTRDLNYADAVEGFTLVDTGGFEPAAKTDILRKVKEQARLAIEEADIVVFVMDGKTGPTPDDFTLVGMLRKTGKPALYAVNKMDTPRPAPLAAEFYSLGVEPLYPVSAEHGFGVMELLDAVLRKLPPPEEMAPPEEMLTVAIVGRPNAGKSSLLNELIGRERAIVSEVPGTTRDVVDTVFERNGKRYLFIDTAGIRKKTRIARTVEAYCVVEAIKSIERADIVLLVLDGFEGMTVQDEKIAGLIEGKSRCAVLVVNKWDIVEKDAKTAALYEKRIRSMAPFLSYAPVVFVSALTGRGIKDIFGIVDALAEESSVKIETPRLNRLLKDFTARHTPPACRGKEVKFYYITQTGARPVRLTVFANFPEGVEESYRRYLAGAFREALSLKNIPIRIAFKKRR
jgi:GTP-binding protein